MPNALASLVTPLATLAAVLGLIVVAGRFVRSAGLARSFTPHSAAGGPRLAILDTLPLDRARRLHVVRWEGQDFVLLTGGQTDQVVGWVPLGDRS